MLLHVPLLNTSIVAIPMQLRGTILISKEIYARGEIRC